MWERICIGCLASWIVAVVLGAPFMYAMSKLAKEADENAARALARQKLQKEENKHDA